MKSYTFVGAPFALFLTCLFLLAGGCTKEGLIGEQGPEGAQGEKGEQGPPGTGGSGGVIASNWAKWLEVVTSPYYDHHVPELTEEVIENNVVLVFLRTTVEATIVVQLPGKHPWYDHTITMEIMPEYIRLLSSNGEFIADENTEFRYVLIPTSMMQAKQVDIHNYQQVIRTFGLVK